jgi:hypothetical protein
MNWRQLLDRYKWGVGRLWFITMAPLVLHFFTGQFKGFMFESRVAGFFALALALTALVVPTSYLHLYLLEKREKRNEQRRSGKHPRHT